MLKKALLTVIFLDILTLTLVFWDFETLLFRKLTTFFDKPAFTEDLESSGLGKSTSGGGAAWGDYNRDGCLDILIINANPKLFENTCNGQFREVTLAAKLPTNGSFSAGSFADYDNDGCEDLYLTSYGQDNLYHSNCDNTFTDVTDISGLVKENYTGYGSSWGDYDNDGYLDLYVANYGSPVFKNPTDTLPEEFIYQPNFLYHNNQDGTFTETSKLLGLTGIGNCLINNNLGFKVTGEAFKQSYQPVWFDYNNDGKTDLFVANDSSVSPLYRNDGNSHFTETTKEAGLCRGGDNMGVAVGDYDNDGYQDLYVTNSGANFLWHNKNGSGFEELGAETGVADHKSLGWGAGFIDFDNDMDVDLYVVNGLVSVGHEQYREFMGDRLFLNKQLKFTDVAQANGINGNKEKESLAIGDYNNDGFVDMFVGGGNDLERVKNRLYKNSSNKNHWITLKLVGTKSNQNAVGTKVVVTTDKTVQFRQVISGSSFISQDSLWQTFGLGKNANIQEIKITWPTGKNTLLHNIKANQELTIKEPND